MEGVRYSRDGREVLAGLDLRVESGRSVSIVGPSGSGKTTLLDVAAGILIPASGRVTVQDLDLTGADARSRARMRLQHIGIVFQFADLLPELTLRENVEVPMRFAGRGTVRDVHERSGALLDEFGLGGLAERLPSQVSGGERQRAGIARALANDPSILLADEPTGSLDPALAGEAMRLLLDAVRRRGAALVLVTHNFNVSSLADEQLELVSGRLRSATS